jgi:ribosome-associated protein
MTDDTGPIPAVPVLVLGRGLGLPLSEITWRFSASGGPGGQHVNTSNTRAEATFDIARSPSLPEWARLRLVATLGPVVSVAASDTRSQSRNRQLAVERLANRLTTALEVPRSRRPTQPGRAAARRRVEAKRRRGQLKSERRKQSGGGDE